jgi:hypothetical protein
MNTEVIRHRLDMDVAAVWLVDLLASLTSC